MSEIIRSFFRREKLSTSDIKIEPLQEKDIPSFIKIFETDEGSQFLLSLIKRPDEFIILVAKDKTGRIVGGLESHIGDFSGKKAGYVDYISVDKSQRGQGIGFKVLKAYEDILLGRGNIFYICSAIFSTNTASLRIHEKMGITSVSIGSAYFSSYFKKIR